MARTFNVEHAKPKVQNQTLDVTTWLCVFGIEIKKNHVIYTSNLKIRPRVDVEQSKRQTSATEKAPTKVERRRDGWGLGVDTRPRSGVHVQASTSRSRFVLGGNRSPDRSAPRGRPMLDVITVVLFSEITAPLHWFADVNLSGRGRTTFAGALCRGRFWKTCKPAVFAWEIARYVY